MYINISRYMYMYQVGVFFVCLETVHQECGKHFIDDASFRCRGGASRVY